MSAPPRLDAVPLPPVAAAASLSEAEAQARVDLLEREAKALGADPQAALLFHEMGKLFEFPLRKTKQAALAYQQAFKLAPQLSGNLRSARRLFSHAGNWGMVVQLLDAEIKESPSPAIQAALLLDRAEILRKHLDRKTDAEECEDQAWQRRPPSWTVCLRLLQLFLTRKAHVAAVQVNEHLAELSTDDISRSHFLTQAGLITESVLADLPRAAGIFRRAFALHRSNPLLLASMKRVAHLEGTVDEELGALASEAELQGDLSTPTFLQISRSYERLGRSSDALKALLAARRLSPQDPLVLSELARVYESENNPSALVETLGEWAASVRDDEEFIALQLRRAQLAEQALSDTATAVAGYRAVLERQPLNISALSALGRLYFQLQNWEDLVKTFDAEVQATPDAKHQAARLFKAAEIVEQRLARPDEAISRYQQCLTRSPGFLPARRAIIRLLEQRGRFQDLLHLYESDLSLAKSPEQRLLVFKNLAQLYEGHLGQVAQAITCYQQMLEVDAKNAEALSQLARLLEGANLWKDRVALLAHEAEVTSDAKEMVEHLHRMAEIQEDRLRDDASALGTYERILKVAPNYVPALRGLGRLYAKTGQWEALVQMHRAEAETWSSPEQAAALIFRAGELYERKLNDLEKAVATYQEALSMYPELYVAQSALARIYKQQANWRGLLDMLHREAQARRDPLEKANSLFLAASVHDELLGERPEAIAGYQAALALVPGHASALQQLERLLLAEDDPAALVALYQQQAELPAPQTKLGAWLKLARLSLDRMGDPSAAASYCEQVLSVDPQQIQALHLLERARWMLGTPAPSLSPQQALNPAWAAAVEVAGAESAGALPLGLQEKPPDPALLRRLEGSIAAAPSFEKQERWLQAEWAAAQFPLERARLGLRLAELYESVGRNDDALSTYEGVLTVAPSLVVAQMGLAHCLAKTHRTDAAAEIYARVAEGRHAPQTRVEARVLAARLWSDQSGAPNDKAMQAWSRVLELDPLHAEATAAVEQLLRGRGSPEALAKHYERRAEGQQKAGNLEGAATDFLAAAKLALDQRQATNDAMALLNRGLQCLPTHPETLELKAELQFQAGQYAEAAASLEARLLGGGASARLAPSQLRLGILYAEHLQQPEKALGPLQAVLRVDPRHREAWERISVALLALKRANDAAEAVKRWIELVESPAEKASICHKVCDALEAQGDLPAATQWLQRALQFAPGQVAALEKLCSFLGKQGRKEELAHALELWAQHAGDAPSRAAVRLRLAEHQGKVLGNPAKAVAALRSAIDAEPNNLAAWIELSKWLGQDSSQINAAIDAHRTILRLSPARAESLHALFRLWETVRQLDKAYCATAVLVFLKVADGVESAFYQSASERLSQQPTSALSADDLSLLPVGQARTALAEICRALGDQLAKLFPPSFEAAGVDKKADRIKNDQPIYALVKSFADFFQADAFELYQSRKAVLQILAQDPTAVCLGQDALKRYNPREQRFLAARAAFALLQKSGLARQLTPAQLPDFLLSALRVVKPDFKGFGSPNDDWTKQIKKLASRKALKVLEEIANHLQEPARLDPSRLVDHLGHSELRAGLLGSPDLLSGLNLILHKDAPVLAQRKLSNAEIALEVERSAELRALLHFVLAEDFFRLRQRAGLGLG